MIQAIIILLALISGYLINFKFISNNLINKVLSITISLIIFIMGYNFGVLILSLTDKILSMSAIISLFIASLLIANTLSIKLFLILKPKYAIQSKTTNNRHTRPIGPILTSCVYLLYLTAGIILGYISGISLTSADIYIDALLVLTLFAIGIQLKREGLSLTQVLKNKTGIAISLVLIISSLLAGAITGYTLNIPIMTSLMLSSGFRWYSLSSILNAQLLDAHYGTMTFFIDFAREILAIILIPILAKTLPTELIGYSGATAMDFTLPVIKENIGIKAIPIAISTGFIL